MKFKLREFILSVCVVIMAAGNMASAQSIVPRKDDKKGQWGYVSTASGKWVVKPKYDAAAELTSAPNGQLRAVVTLKGKTGFVDDNGKLLGAGAVFEEVTPLEGNAMFVTVKGKKGVVNYDGVYLVKPEIIDVAELPGEGYLVSVKDKKGILKYDGTWLLDPLYKEIDTSLPYYFLVNKGGKAGIADRKGSVLLAPGDFTGVEPFGKYWKVRKGNKVGLFDLKKNQLLVKPDYADVGMPIVASNGSTLYPVSGKPGKWGAVNAEGKGIIKNNFTEIRPIGWKNALLLFEGQVAKRIYFPGDKKPYKVQSYKWTPIAGKAKQIDFMYNKDWSWHSVSFIQLPDGSVDSNVANDVWLVNQFVAHKKPGLGYTLFDGDGAVFMDIYSRPFGINGWTCVGDRAVSPDSKIYSCRCDADASLLIETSPGTYNLVTDNGTLSDFAVTETKQLQPGFVAVSDGQKWGIMQHYKIVRPLQYDKAPERLGDDYIVIYDNGQATLHYKSLDKLIEGDYDSFALQNNYILPVRNGKKTGVFDREGNNLYSAECDSLLSVEYGVHLLKNGPYVMIYDTNKNSWRLTAQKQFTELVDLTPRWEGLFKVHRVKKNGKYGLYNLTSDKILVEPVYDSILRCYGNCCELKNGNKTVYFELEHREILTPGISMSLTYKSLQGGPGMDYEQTRIILPGVEKVTMDITVYNKNGKVLKNSEGYIVGTDIDFSLEDGFCLSAMDRIMFPYSNFPYGNNNYYILVKFKDEKGRTLPYKGKTKFPFSVNRPYPIRW